MKKFIFLASIALMIWGTTPVSGQHTTYLGRTDAAYNLVLDAFNTPSTWMVDIGEYADTLKTALDSLTVLKLADTVNLPAEYSTYAHVFGNGTATGDSIFFAKAFKPQTSNPDSIYFWIYASSTSKDSASVGLTISQKTGTTDTPFNTLVITATTANTWERKVYAFDDFLSGVYTAIIRARVALGYKINFSPIYFK